MYVIEVSHLRQRSDLLRRIVLNPYALDIDKRLQSGFFAEAHKRPECSERLRKFLKRAEKAV
jgi:hypothetical protein